MTDNIPSRRDYKRLYDERRKVSHKSVHLTMTIEEYLAFKDVADSLGTSPNKAIIQLAQTGAQVIPPPLPQATRDFIRQSLITVRRTGQVFNQCARQWFKKAYIPENQRELFIENCEFLAQNLQLLDKQITGLGTPQQRHDP